MQGVHANEIEFFQRGSTFDSFVIQRNKVVTARNKKLKAFSSFSVGNFRDFQISYFAMDKNPTSSLNRKDDCQHRFGFQANTRLCLVVEGTIPTTNIKIDFRSCHEGFPHSRQHYDF